LSPTTEPLGIAPERVGPQLGCVSGWTQDTPRLADGAERLAEVVSTARPWFLGYARVGYVARGVVHVLVGGLALAAALGERGGRVTDAPGALLSVARAPFGRPVLVLVAAGLLGYAGVRIAVGLLDPARRPRSLRMALIRMGEVLSGAGYLLLVWGALSLATGNGAPPTGDARARVLSHEALQLPFGVWLMVLAAVIFAAIGVWFLVRALLVRDVCKDLDVTRLGRSGCRIAAFFIRVGSASQGTMFAWVGYLLLRAATRNDPRQARGMDGVLRLLEGYGEGLLALMALGLVAVGVSAFIEARWRRIV
jgi:hypothetical protein